MFIKMSKKVKIRGVFASWTMTEVERKPEARFRSKLETNPTYPFIPVSESHRNILVYRRRSRKIVAGVLALFVACAFALALYYSQRSSFAEGGLSVFCVPAFIGVWALATVVLNLQILVYVIDHASATYEYYKGSTSVYKGELRNMYVRLRRQTTGVGHHFYYDTTLNGFMMEPVVLSDKSCNAVGMDRLARSLAHRLHINYFDIKNKSQTHVLRHSRQTRPDTAFTEVTV